MVLLSVITELLLLHDKGNIHNFHGSYSREMCFYGSYYDFFEFDSFDAEILGIATFLFVFVALKGAFNV